MSLPSAVHVFSIIKREASGDWEARYFVVFGIGSFAKYVYMCICILYLLFLLLLVFCFVQKKKEGVETRVVITERVGRTKSVSYLCFPIISDERYVKTGNCHTLISSGDYYLMIYNL